MERRSKTGLTNICPGKRSGPQGLNSLLKNSAARRVGPSAAKAGTENKVFIAAVNRCATQKLCEGVPSQETIYEGSSKNFHARLVREGNKGRN